jgi:hypothetical protein
MTERAVEVRNLGDWADEHWDVLVVVVLTMLAVAVSALLAVVYNITATWFDPSVSTPYAVELWPEVPVHDAIGRAGASHTSPPQAGGVPRSA